MPLTAAPDEGLAVSLRPGETGGCEAAHRQTEIASGKGHLEDRLAAVPAVADDAIVTAQKVLWQVLRVVAEPGGAAAFSAILCGVYKPEIGERVAVVISGGNTTAVNFEG